MNITGKKTYIAAALAVVAAALTYVQGEATLIEAAQLAFTAIIGAFLRAGVAKAA